jgi:hypothetical protein
MRQAIRLFLSVDAASFVVAGLVHSGVVSGERRTLPLA